MADLSHLIFRVRGKLSDVPVDHVDDMLVLDDIKDAYDFVTMIAVDDVKTEYLERCTVNLAAFKTYLNYTSIASRRLGEIDPSSIIKLDALRKNARSCLSLISKYPLNEDLSVNLDALHVSPVAGSLSPSVLR